MNRRRRGWFSCFKAYAKGQESKTQSQALARLLEHFCPEMRVKWRSAIFPLETNAGDERKLIEDVSPRI